MSDTQPEPAEAVAAYRAADNPFFRPLVWFGVVILVVGFVVLYIGAAASDTSRVAIGGSLMGLGGLLFVGGLVVGGIDWAISHRR